MELPKTDNKKEWALYYASLGLAVAPLKPLEKKYFATTHGFNDASKDPEQIKKWWSENPNYNIAIKTGTTSNVLVVDKDEKGKNGLAIYKKWCQDNGVNPPITWKAISPSGGEHEYWYTKEAFSSPLELLGCIDIRADGACIVAPPSVTRNGKYTWTECNPTNYPMNALPKELAFFARHPGKTKTINIADMNKPQNTDPDKSQEHKPICKTIQEGGRTGYFTTAIGKLVKDDYFSDEMIKAMVQTLNDKFTDRPLSENQLNKEVFPLLDRSYINNKGNPGPAADTLLSKLKRLSAYERKEVEWLIPGYIPKGCITLLCSDGGIGKGGVWTGIAAAISKGEVPEFLDIPFKPLNLENNLVIYASSEDSTEHVIKGRILNNGGCEDNIIPIPLNEDEFRDLTFDSATLETVISSLRPAIVIFDPIQSFIDKAVRMNERNAMRQTLNPLLKMGEKYGTSFLLVVHCNKGRGNYGRNRVSDSSDIWDIARSVLMCGFTENRSIRYLSHEKTNYGDLADTVLFSFEDGKIVNKGKSQKRDREFQSEMQFVKTSPAKDEAADFILDYLRNGPSPVKDLDEAAKAAGLSNYSLRTAKKELKENNEIKFQYKSEGPGKQVCTISLYNDNK